MPKKKPDASRHAPEEIDAYLAKVPSDMRACLEQVRNTVRQTASECTERVSYGIPIFRLRRDLVGISAQKHHCSLHTMSPSLMKVMAEDLKDVKVSGATIHFTPADPLPGALLERIVRERMTEVGAA